jgi:hypothetical protein
VTRVQEGSEQLRVVVAEAHRQEDTVSLKDIKLNHHHLSLTLDGVFKILFMILLLPSLSAN